MLLRNKKRHAASPAARWAKKRLAIFLGLTLALICSSCWWIMHDSNPLRASCRVERLTCYALPAGASDTLYFTALCGDTVICRPDYEADSAMTTCHAIGLRVGLDGTVQTAMRPVPHTLPERLLRPALSRELARLDTLAQSYTDQQHELDYYARTHSVVDDGYNEVMAHRSLHARRMARTDSVRTLLRKALEGKNLMATRRCTYFINGLPATPKGSDLDALLPLTPAAMPADSNAKPRPLMRYELIASPAWTDARPRCLEVSAALRLLTPGATYVAAFTDSFSRRFQGVWLNDSVFSGTCLMPDGSQHEGRFDAQLRPDGFGVSTEPDGTYYAGEWQEGLRNGFGFVADAHFVKCGTWRAGRFQGERMLYTAGRIYGIDISRYQHEQGRKRFSINWNDLRITNLGTTSKRRVQGTVDYPVSFVFIKATQGTSIRSRYYYADLNAALRKGIAASAYHFFTPKPGRDQARYFIKNAALHRVTLPPMLDVEPTEKQIAQMGGERAMFREMLVWLRMVEAACNRRPVLYVSQTFVNRHFVNAPPELRAYDMWIARYGEYKPYVKLLFWQLSPDGRVKGIHGDVDINVFNGTREQLQQLSRKK